MGLLVSFLNCILNCLGSQMQDGIGIKLWLLKLFECCPFRLLIKYYGQMNIHNGSCFWGVGK